jgi:hypothetical protein
MMMMSWGSYFSIQYGMLCIIPPNLPYTAILEMWTIDVSCAFYGLLRPICMPEEMEYSILSR